MVAKMAAETPLIYATFEPIVLQSNVIANHDTDFDIGKWSSHFGSYIYRNIEIIKKNIQNIC